MEALIPFIWWKILVQLIGRKTRGDASFLFSEPNTGNWNGVYKTWTYLKTLINGQSYLVLSYQKKQFMNKLKMKSQCTPHIWIPNLVLHAHTHHSTRCGCGATVVNRKCLQCQAYHNVVIKKNFFCSSPNTNTKTWTYVTCLNLLCCEIVKYMSTYEIPYLLSNLLSKQSIVGLSITGIHYKCMISCRFTVV